MHAVPIWRFKFSGVLHFAIGKGLPACPTTQSYILEDLHLQQNCCENPKSYSVSVFIETSVLPTAVLTQK
jgi:hypothetical protein